MNRTVCGGCSSSDLTEFLDLGQTPLANSFPDSDTVAESYYGLGLCRCDSCGLVQNTEVIPDELIYGGDYGFYSGGSQAQRDYHLNSARMLMDRYPRERSSRVMEVACNDGSLLKYFDVAGYQAHGVDPSKPAQDAYDAGLDVYVLPFTADFGRDYRDERGPVDLVICYNALAHVNDLGNVLTGIWAVLASTGEAVIEVQYLPDLLVGNMFDQVYHEHRYFHSLSSFSRLAALHQLYVVDAELIELQGGGIRITLSPDNEHLPSSRAYAILESERWLNDPTSYAGVQGRIDRVRQHLLDLLGQEIDAGRSVAGYAAAAKATTILNFCGIGPDQLPYVHDTTPHKWGRYVPGTRVPIRDPGADPLERPDTYLLLAPNYLGHVLRRYADTGVRWLTPIPTPALI